MQFEEYRQLRVYARYDGIYLGILWLASFACTVLSSFGSIIGALGNLLLLATPFFVAYRLKKYREDALGGAITFSKALLYCFRVFFGAAFLFAVCQWLYMQFLDGGRLRTMYVSMLSMPEIKPILRAYGVSQSQLKDAVQQMFDPVFLASYSFIIAIIAGAVMSILIAAIMQRKNAGQ